MNSCSLSLMTRDVLHMHSSVVGQRRLDDLVENCVIDCGTEIETTKMEMAERVSG